MLPSLPGYGFSGEPTELGWNVGRVAQAWAELMRRLGYTRYVAQGGDVGAAVTDAMGRQAPEGLLGIHVNLLVTVARRPPSATESEQERAALGASTRSRRAASATSWRWPRGRRRSATRCWIRRSPWRPGCSTTTRTATTRSPAPSSTGEPAGNLTRDNILDNITLYWLTGTGASAARSYWEDGRAVAAAAAAGQAPPEVSIPVGFTTFPGEIWRTPRSWVEQLVPEPHLLQRGRQGRALRRLGGAGVVRH